MELNYSILLKRRTSAILLIFSMHTFVYLSLNPIREPLLSFITSFGWARNANKLLIHFCNYALTSYAHRLSLKWISSSVILILIFSFIIAACRQMCTVRFYHRFISVSRFSVQNVSHFYQFLLAKFTKLSSSNYIRVVEKLRYFSS